MNIKDFAKQGIGGAISTLPDKVLNNAKKLAAQTSLLSGNSPSSNSSWMDIVKSYTDPYKKVTRGYDLDKIKKLSQKKEQVQQFITSPGKQYYTPSYATKGILGKQLSLLAAANQREKWIKNEIFRQAPEELYRKGILYDFNSMPYGELKRQFPSEVDQLEIQYNNNKITNLSKPEDVALERIRLSQLKFTKDYNYDPVTDTYTAKHLKGEYIDPNKQLYDDFEKTSKLFLQSIPAGALGYETEAMKEAIESGDLMSQIAVAGGSLTGFLIGLKGIGRITKALEVTGKTTQAVRALGVGRKSSRLTGLLVRSGLDFTLLGQVHSTVRGDSLKEHFKSGAIDFGLGGVFTIAGKVIDQLPKVMQPIVEGSAWATIVKAQGGDTQTALIQGIMMAGMRGFGVDWRKTGAVEEMFVNAEKYLKAKKGDIAGIVEAFQKKTKNLKQGSLEYQKAEASAVVLLYPRQVFGTINNISSFREDRLVGLFGKDKFKEGERPGIEKPAPLPEVKPSIASLGKTSPSNKNEIIVSTNKGDVGIIATIEGKTIKLGNIRAIDKGRGAGTEGIAKLVKFADDNGLDIKGVILKSEPGGLSQSQLVQFYKKNGFDVDESGFRTTLFRNAKGKPEVSPELKPQLPDITLKTDRTIGIGGEKKLTPEELYERDITPEKANKKLQRSFDKLKELGTKEIPIEKFNPLEAKEINPIQRTLAEAQAVKFEVKSRLEGMVEAFKRSLNIKELEDIKTGNALTERIDMGKPLPENLKKLETLIPLLTEQQKFLSSQLKSKKIAEALWDEETYVRRILVQKDGSKPTATQLAALEVASDKIKGDLMRVASGSTQYGLSTKSKFYQKRKFKTIDQADAYLDKFGLKMNRNFFKSLIEQWNQASDILYNYTFTKSLRDQAKLGIKGVKEIYDPAEFKLAVEEEGLKMRSIIDSLLGKSKQLKNISNDQYKELKEHAKEEYSRMKNRSKKTLEKEDYKEAIENLDMSFGAFKESLLGELKMGKVKITNEIKGNIESVRKVFGERTNNLKIDIRKKWAEAQDAGYGKLPDVVLANQLRGVVLTKDLSKSLKHVLAQKPTLTSVEDAIVTLKTAQLTMDVFKIKDLIEASFGTGFIQSPVSMYRFRDTAEYIATAKKHIRGGLSVDVPIDVNVKLLERMGELKEVKETESLFLKYLHKGAETKIGKVVAYPFEKALILENFQWNIELPAYKVKTADLLYEAMQKKYPNIPKEDLLFRVDDFVNSAFQGQNWEQIMAKHPNLTHGTPRLLRALFLGPDKITSTFRLATTSAKIGNKALGARMLGKYVFRTFAMGTLITQILNYALNGHSTLENTRGNEFSVEVPGLEDEKGNPFSFQIYGSAFEIIKFLNKPLPTLRNKQTGMLSSLLEIIKPSYGKVQPSRVMESIEPLPINLQTMLSYAYGQMFDNGEPQYGRPETFIGALANLGAEFSGFPTTYRTGKGEMSLVDVLRGDFIFKKYILGEKPKSEKAGTLKMPELKGGKKKEKAKGKIDFSKIKF